MSLKREPSFCRVCFNFCPIVVTVDDGRVARVEGDRENVVWRGHTCIKGRAQGERLRSERRLLHSLRRTASGALERVASGDAIGEVAARLEAILAEHGPDAVAFYEGSSTPQHATTDPFAHAFLDSIGVRLRFTPNTIDKPGKSIAKALHGTWQAPAQGFHDPDVVMLVGVNPLVSYEGAPVGNPGWLHERVALGMKVVVIDPRRTETARHATLHLRPRPGHDAAILAAIVKVILDGGLYDAAFVAENVTGLDALRTAVAPFEPESVAARAGIPAAGIVAAARIYGAGRRGYVFSGTGPSMSSPGPLTEYLVLALLSLCGHYLRAGETVENAAALFRTPAYKAQANPPKPALRDDRPFHVRGLKISAAGPPTAAFAERALRDDGNRIRALISCGGNPANAWPDQPRVVRALKSLDLLVQIDPVLSETARLAHYVIAPKMPLETPDMSMWHDFLAIHGLGYGNVVSHGQYTPAIVDPPEGSDVIGEWEFFYELARRMGKELTIQGACYGFRAIEPFAVDMTAKPDEDEVLERLATGSRVALAEVKRHPHGQTFPDPVVTVAPKDDAWPHRLDVGNPEMVAALRELAEAEHVEPDGLRLVCRRSRGMFNSWLNDGSGTRGRRDNPAYLHPDDLARLGLTAGDTVEIRSAHGAVLATVERDPDLLPGLLSISHGFGALGGDGEPDVDHRATGSSVQRLLSTEDHADTYSGMPRMSNVPVEVTRVGLAV